MNDKQKIAILRKALVDVVQKLGQMPGWRRVEDGLPEGEIVVLTYGEDHSFSQYETARYLVGEKVSYWTNSQFNPTHWQPLPAAPSDSTPTLAETLQAICASALGDAEIGES